MNVSFTPPGITAGARGRGWRSMEPWKSLQRPRPRVSELVQHLWQPLRRSTTAPASCYVLNISIPRPRAHQHGGEIPPVRTRPGDRSDRDAGGSGRSGRALMCLGPGRRALAARGRYGHCTWARRLRNGHSLGTLKISGPSAHPPVAAAKACAAAAQRTEACPCTLILTTRMQHACIRLDAHAQLTFKVIK